MSLPPIPIQERDFSGYKTCIPPIDEQLPTLPTGSITALLGGPAEYPEILAFHIARTCTPTLQVSQATLVIPRDIINTYLGYLEKTGQTLDMISYNMAQDKLRIYTHDNARQAIEIARADRPPTEPWIRIIDLRGTSQLTSRELRLLHETRGLNILIPGKEIESSLYPLLDVVIKLEQTAAGNVALKLIYSSTRPGVKAELYYKVSVTTILFSMESRV